jgi:hypothetical protein
VQNETVPLWCRRGKIERKVRLERATAQHNTRKHLAFGTVLTTQMLVVVAQRKTKVKRVAVHATARASRFLSHDFSIVVIARDAAVGRLGARRACDCTEGAVPPLLRPAPSLALFQRFWAVLFEAVQFLRERRKARE